ncbi:DUF4145 domain-containing protein [Alcanivorax marinus]|uniref:DUF4145 domain-containing protein n=1 Tax=Alloalcanivorax marinus TaxID=1177169 RepID=A0A9Q3UR48_9GAMM|nr:DUF4145 domain-containing protein [Alloalcanivorax marinus]MCC4310268.1 DUF4145 domain-containing protein [Alloalcanivorax marinus]MCU5785586.1 hypothetical protein [Alloalcanivorax marinus]
MPELVANCPRCKANEMTFDLLAEIHTHTEYDWQRWYEAFCVCRRCLRSTIFVLAQNESVYDAWLRNNRLSQLTVAVNQVFNVKGHISLKDSVGERPPDHLPENINSAFKEGAACMAIGCNNAAATMFRLCIDLATRAMLPSSEVEGLNNRIRRNLGLRLPWLFDQGVLPESLRELSACIKDDGNDGAHEGSLSEEDSADILDFSYILLERIYTEPRRVEIASARRAARRSERSP